MLLEQLRSSKVTNVSNTLLHLSAGALKLRGARVIGFREAIVLLLTSRKDYFNDEVFSARQLASHWENEA